MSISFWVCGAVTLISAGVSLGYSIAALRRFTSGSRSADSYAFARSLALALVATVALFVPSVPFLAAVAMAMILVQTADAVIGALHRRRLETIGPAATALVNAAALSWLLLS